MSREITNSVTIVGTLMEVRNLREGTIRNGANTGHNYISGDAIMSCNEKKIPISFFSVDTTKAKTHSKLYDSYKELSSIVGQRICWSNASLEERRFISKKHDITSSQRIKGRFYNEAPANRPDTATFQLNNVFIAKSIEAKKDKNDNVYSEELDVGQQNYNNSSASMFKMNVGIDELEKIKKISSLNPGTTISLNGHISVEVKNTEVKSDEKGENLFGEAEVKSYTNTYYSYIIDHLVVLPLTEPDNYTKQEIGMYKDARASAANELLERAKESNRAVNADDKPNEDVPLSSKAESLL